MYREAIETLKLIVMIMFYYKMFIEEEPPDEEIDETILKTMYC